MFWHTCGAPEVVEDVRTFLNPALEATYLVVVELRCRPAPYKETSGEFFHVIAAG